MVHKVLSISFSFAISLVVTWQTKLGAMFECEQKKKTEKELINWIDLFIYEDN